MTPADPFKFIFKLIVQSFSQISAIACLPSVLAITEVFAMVTIKGIMHILRKTNEISGTIFYARGPVIVFDRQFIAKFVKFFPKTFDSRSSPLNLVKTPFILFLC